jgi:hypothetical protein
MTNTVKPKDDEMKVWLGIGILFTIFLLVIDFFYSSVNSMALVARIGVYALHAAISVCWLVTMAKFNDPAFDNFRKYVVYLCVLTALIVGIHHSLAVEDKSVIDDSNQAKKADSAYFHKIVIDTIKN